MTNFASTSVSKFDNAGNLVSANFLTGLSSPESCVIDTSGNIYVGGPRGPIRKFSLTTGGAPTATFAVNPGDGGNSGSDWIDLANDQCTMFFTDEGANVNRINVCTNTALTPFASGLAGRHFALRILPDGGVIVAAETQVQRLNSSGTVISTYTGDNLFFALNRDPDGVTFWTGGLISGNIYRFNFSPVGAPITTFNSVPLTNLAGLAVFGELVVSQPTPTPTGTVQPTATPTPTPTGTVQPTATATPTSTNTPAVTVVVPTLTPPMLALLGLALLGAAVFLMRR